jgi:hypothetical protein
VQVRIVTPMLWGRLYELSFARGTPALFYYVLTAGGLAQLPLLRALSAAARVPGGEDARRDFVQSPLPGRSITPDKRS